MFALGIRYLNGWAMAAADGAKKERAEWPPHPDRVFMALAAAYFETEGSDNERAALEWLEQQGSPSFAGITEGHQRTLVTHYVPVNDAALSGNKTVAKAVAGMGTLATLKDCGLNQLPEYRSRQPRSFPLVVPQQPELYLVWALDLHEPHRTALTSLCRKVTHLGHSASFVQMWLTGDAPEPNLVPREGVTRRRLRVYGPGRLGALEARCNRDAVIAYAELESRLSGATVKEKKTIKAEIQDQFPRGRPVSLRPETALATGYDQPRPLSSATIPGSLFDPNLIVLTLSGQRLGLHSTLKLTETLRNAVMKACPDQPPPEWVSGHTSEGRATKKPHLAFIPLPFVGHEHADGHILGLALAVPRDVPGAETMRHLGPLLWDVDTGEAREIMLYDGRWLECRVQFELRESPPYNLQADTWTRSAARWASVTPITLDRHFDGKDKWERAAESIKDACERIDLPRPIDVLLHPVSLCEGAPRANEFPYLTRKSDGGQMHHGHAVLIFAEPVHGPLLLGAGRFRGYGLCRPLSQGGEAYA